MADQGRSSRERRELPAMIRVARAEDGERLADLLAACSADSLRQRFLSTPPRMTGAVIDRMLRPLGGFTLLAVDRDGAALGAVQVTPVGAATVDVAVLISDDDQRRGLGERLVRSAARRAAAVGFTEMVACGTPDNRGLVRLLARLGLAPYGRLEDGLLAVRAPLAAVDAPTGEGFDGAGLDGAGLDGAGLDGAGLDAPAA
jgi:GNAT superfamily N-acetyltransferase